MQVGNVFTPYAITEDGRDPGCALHGRAPPIDDLQTDWRELVDMPHIKSDELRELLLAYLERHTDMWSGSLGNIKAS